MIWKSTTFNLVFFLLINIYWFIHMHISLIPLLCLKFLSCTFFCYFSLQIFPTALSTISRPSLRARRVPSETPRKKRQSNMAGKAIPFEIHENILKPQTKNGDLARWVFKCFSPHDYCQPCTTPQQIPCNSSTRERMRSLTDSQCHPVLTGRRKTKSVLKNGKDNCLVNCTQPWHCAEICQV